MMSGDSICQIFIENKKPFDKQRTLRFGLFGLVIQAPIVSVPVEAISWSFLFIQTFSLIHKVRMWYVTLERMFPVNNGRSAIKKLICDQVS